MIETKLLDILVCPVTKGKLEYDRDHCWFVSHQAGLIFPFVDGIPDMRLDTALTLEPTDKSLK